MLPSNIDFDIKLDTKQLRGLLKAKGPEGTKVREILADPAAAYFAGRSRDWLHAILSDSSKTQGVVIKASGRSAENIKVAKINATMLGGGAYMVYEAGMTPANRYIRTGTPKQGRPPVTKIKAYIQQKGVSYFRGIYSSVTSGRHLSRDPIEDVAWAVSGAIAKRGTSTAHKKLYPGGQKRFDYVTYGVLKLKMLKRIYAEFRVQGMPKTWKQYVAYLKTATWKKGMANDFYKIRKRV